MNLKTKTINVKKENLSYVERIIEELYVTNKSIFKTVSLEKIRDYVFAKKSKINKIRLFYDNNNIVGFCTFQTYKIFAFKENFNILKMGAGFLPKYYGYSFPRKFVLFEIIKQFICEKNSFLFGAAVNPVSYCLVHGCFKEVHPSPYYKTSKQYEYLSEYLTNIFFPDVIKRDGDSLISNTGWAPIEIGKSEKWNTATKKKEFKFYMNKNIDFYSGHGLIVLIPINFKNVAHFARKVLKQEFNSKLIDKIKSY